MEIRPVRETELVAACRLTFPGLPWRDDLARAAIDRAPAEMGVDFRRQIVALRDGQVVGSCLYVLTPGRSSIVLGPVLTEDYSTDESWAALVELVAQARQACQAAGAALVQSLLDDRPDGFLGRVFVAAGFAPLALLEYFEAPVSQLGDVTADGSWDYETYRPELEGEFSALIRATYQESLDCPRLDSIRTARDALAGHKASGQFTPENWVLARRRGAAAGLVLVNRVIGKAACELVYMGVSPAFRHQGLGAWLVRKAIQLTRAAGQPLLTLAVDADNAPARGVYLAAGFRKVHQRYAYFVPPAR